MRFSPPPFRPFSKRLNTSFQRLIGIFIGGHNCVIHLSHICLVINAVENYYQKQRSRKSIRLSFEYDAV